MSGLGNKDVMSKNIRYYMDKNGKTRNDICTDLDIKYPTLTDWINGNKYPRIDKIELLAKYFGIQKSDLIEEHPYKDSSISIGSISGIQKSVALIGNDNTVSYNENSVEISPQAHELIRIYNLLKPKSQFELMALAYKLEESELK